MLNYQRPEGISSIRELFPIDFTTREFLKMEDPQSSQRSNDLDELGVHDLQLWPELPHIVHTHNPIYPIYG